MSEFDSNAAGMFKELEAQFDQLKGEVLDAAQRKALRKVAEIRVPALVAATPTAATTPTGTALPKGALKAAVRARILLEKGGLPAECIVGFGKLGYVANFVDNGHKSGKAGHTAGTGFVRRAEDASRNEVNEAYLETMATEIEKALPDGE